MDTKEIEKPKEKALVAPDNEQLKKNQTLGMADVDPQDIRPPMVILMNALSSFSSFTDEEGNHPEAGEFFHNGTLRILKDFDCYFIWAGKGVFIDKRHPEDGEKKMYRVIGIMADDSSIFGMRFKVSSLYALSPLFTAVTANKRGMYSIRCKMEAKLITGKKGSWFVPTLSVTGFENDVEKLKILEAQAMIYDRMGAKAAPKDENEEEVVTLPPEPPEIIDKHKPMANENVNTEAADLGMKTSVHYEIAFKSLFGRMPTFGKEDINPVKKKDDKVNVDDIPF